MAKRKVANPLAFAVLGSLSERPMHPYEISTMLKTRGKDQSIKLNYGSLYSVVAALQKHGLIEAVETVREGNRPERTVYALTAAGGQEFDEWLSEFIGEPSRDFSQLEAGLAYMPALSPDRTVELLDQRRQALQAEVDRLEAVHVSPQLKSLPRLFWVESEFRLAMLKAEVAYVEQLAEEIRTDKLEGGAFWRHGHEVMRDQGVAPGELFAHPEKYLDEEDVAWLRNLPDQTQ
ncbi:PadR family transcriptional regulator [Kribbella sp. NBC_01245]|uniref:PadR family transcriptional regulator n=1 Tax=Kribbella sp. NBC_01245 TaxID=2903578 RepID=UPI002E2E4910|nr:PadR family transcriptional regulator [Kribbella sp. NBC_01245]